MSRVLLVTHDNRLPNQLVSWLEEFPFKVHVSVTQDINVWLEENKSKSKPNALRSAQQSVSPAADANKTVEPDATSTPREPPALVILDYPSSFETSFGWVNALRKKFELNGLVVSDHPVLFLLIVPDDERHLPESFVSSGADDLLMKPIDRTMLLQKIEILLARGKSVTSSFLFRVKSQHPMEVAKEGAIEEISEVECVLRNPRPVRAGAFATLHSDIFGQGELKQVQVRTISSEPSVEHPSEWRVRMRFFALTDAQIRSLRIFLRKLAESRPAGAKVQKLKQKPKLAMIAGAAKAVIAKARGKATETAEKGRPSLRIASKTNVKPIKSPSKGYRPLRLTVLDHEQGIASAMRGALEESLHELSVLEFSGPARYVTGLRQIGVPLAIPAAPVESQKNSVDNKMADAKTGIDSQQQSGETKPSAMPKANESNNESNNASSNENNKPTENHAAKEAAGNVVTSSSGVHSQIVSSAGAVLVEPNDSYLETKEEAMTDLILVDAALLIDDPAGRVMKLLEEYVNAGLAPSIATAPPLIVIGDPANVPQSSVFKVPGVSHFMWRTTDHRHMVETFISLANPEVWKEDVTPIRQEICFRKIFISHPTQLEELAEYGVVIHAGFPFRHGVFLRFYSEVFGREDGVLARCVRSKELEDGEWESEFVFFGTSDEFQKRIRTSIIEDHARKKAKAEG